MSNEGAFSTAEFGFETCKLEFAINEGSRALIRNCFHFCWLGHFSNGYLRCFSFSSVLIAPHCIPVLLSGPCERKVEENRRAEVGGSASIAAFVTASDVDVTYVHLDESLIPSAKEWKVGEHTVTDVRIPLKLEEYMGLAQFWSSHGIPSPGMGACIAILGLDRGFFDTTSKTNAFRLHTQTAPLVVLESCVKTEGWRPNDCGDGDALREGGRILAESRQTRYFEEAIECQSDACIQASGSGCGIRALTYHTPSYRNPVPSWPKRRWFFEGRALLWPFWVPSFTAARPSTALRPPLPTWRDIDVPPPEPRVDYYVGQPDYIATAVLFVLILIASGFFGGSKPKTIRRWMGPSRYRGPAPSAHDQVRAYL